MATVIENYFGSQRLRTGPGNRLITDKRIVFPVASRSDMIWLPFKLADTRGESGAVYLDEGLRLGTNISAIARPPVSA